MASVSPIFTAPGYYQPGVTDEQGTPLKPQAPDPPMATYNPASYTGNTGINGGAKPFQPPDYGPSAPSQSPGMQTGERFEDWVTRNHRAGYGDTAPAFDYWRQVIRDNPEKDSEYWGKRMQGWMAGGADTAKYGTYAGQDFGTFEQQHGGGGAGQVNPYLQQLLALMAVVGQRPVSQAPTLNLNGVASALSQLSQGPTVSGAMGGMTAQAARRNQIVDDAIRRAMGGA